MLLPLYCALFLISSAAPCQSTIPYNLTFKFADSRYLSELDPVLRLGLLGIRARVRSYRCLYIKVPSAKAGMPTVGKGGC